MNWRLVGIALFAVAIVFAFYSEFSGLFWSGGLMGQLAYTLLSVFLAGLGVIFMLQSPRTVSPPSMEKQVKNR